MRLPVIFTFLLCLPSLAFSELMFDGIASYIYGDLMKVRGVELQYKSIKYSDYHVTYQYQYWKVKDKSVCANLKSNLLDYSKCTIEAQKLFGDICTYLQNSQDNGSMKRQLKNMYCSTSVNFKPVIAFISASNEQESELSIARSKCNSLILQSMNTKSSSDIAKRDRACEKYKQLKNK